MSLIERYIEDFVLIGAILVPFYPLMLVYITLLVDWFGDILHGGDNE
jgi:hypothetical protein